MTKKSKKENKASKKSSRSQKKIKKDKKQSKKEKKQKKKNAQHAASSNQVTKLKRAGSTDESRSMKKKMEVVAPKTTSDVIRCLFIDYDKTLDVFQIEKGVYSVCFEYSDISFAKAQRSERFNIFTKWVEYLNSFSENIHVQVINIGRPVQKESFARRYMYEEDKEDYTENEKRIAKEFNKLITRSSSSDDDNLETKRYIVLSANSDSFQKANDLFYQLEIRTEQKFRELKSRIRRVTVDEILEIVYDYFNETKFVDIKSKTREKITSKVSDLLSIFDVLAPKSIDFSHPNYFISDGKYHRIIYLSKIANSTDPVFYNSLTNLDMDLVVTLNIQPQKTADALNKVDKIISAVMTERLQKVKNAAKNGYSYEAVMDLKLEEKLDAYKQLRVDMQKNGQKLFSTNFLVNVTADNEDRLNRNTNKIIDLASEKLIEFQPLDYQQIEGVINLLPFGHNTLQIQRNLTSEATAANVPFNTKDLMYPNSIFYGVNVISHNSVFADRKKLLNGNGCVLATSGAGKSFSVKQMIEQIYLRYPDDDIVVIDPQNEYGPLISALNGQTVTISPTSDTYINPFDLDLNYDDKDPVKAKTDYVIAFIESIVEGNLSGAMKTIVDRCTVRAFEKYEMSGFRDKDLMPDFPQFYDILLRQPEPEARDLSLIVERYVHGAQDIFARRTNVNINNRFVCFDISELSTSMQTTGYLVVLDYIMNKLGANRSTGKNTWIFIDEFHILLSNQYSAEYIAKIYKIGRKYLALPTIITQNIADVLNNEQGQKILSNSEFALILKQKPLDLPNIQAIFDISNAEAEYVMDSPAGQGILYYAGDKVIFKNEVPQDYYIFKLNQTDAIQQGHE